MGATYEYLVDIDSLHTECFRHKLRALYDKTRQNNDWSTYNAFECEWLLPHLAPLTEKHVVLLHEAQKAQLLGLTVVGAWKTSFAVMQRVAAQRNDFYLTPHSWASTAATILETHTDVEQAVLEACRLCVWGA